MAAHWREVQDIDREETLRVTSNQRASIDEVVATITSNKFGEDSNEQGVDMDRVSSTSNEGSEAIMSMRSLDLQSPGVPKYNPIATEVDKKAQEKVDEILTFNQNLGQSIRH